MVKSPLEYLETQNFTVVPSTDEAPSNAEIAFMKKYLGVDPDAVLAGLPLSSPEPVQMPEPANTSGSENVPSPEKLVGIETLPGTETLAGSEKLHGSETGAEVSACDNAPEPLTEKSLKNADQVQFVGFTVGEQLYTIPTAIVQEVIRSMPLCRLPAMPSCMGGVINLRGHVVPVIRLRDILEEAPSGKGEPDAFTIVCRSGGFQVGVQIDRVHSMYRIARQDIRWDAGASIGLGDECVAGLFQLDERLVPIVSMEYIVKTILQK